MFACTQCNERFSRKCNLQRHTNEFHTDGFGAVFHYTGPKKSNHINLFANLPDVKRNGIKRIVSSYAFEGLLKNLRFFSMDEEEDQVREFLMKVKDLVEESYETLKMEGGYKKIITKICVLFSKMSDPTVTDESYFTTPAQHFSEFNYDKVIEQIMNLIENYIKRGSSWEISNVHFLELSVFKN